MINCPASCVFENVWTRANGASCKLDSWPSDYQACWANITRTWGLFSSLNCYCYEETVSVPSFMQFVTQLVSLYIATPSPFWFVFYEDHNEDVTRWCLCPTCHRYWCFFSSGILDIFSVKLTFLQMDFFLLSSLAALPSVRSLCLEILVLIKVKVKSSNPSSCVVGCVHLPIRKKYLYLLSKIYRWPGFSFREMFMIELDVALLDI